MYKTLKMCVTAVWKVNIGLLFINMVTIYLPIAILANVELLLHVELLSSEANSEATQIELALNLSCELELNLSRDVDRKTVKSVWCDTRWEWVTKSYRSMLFDKRCSAEPPQILFRSLPSCCCQTVPDASNFQYFALSHVYLRTH